MTILTFRPAFQALIYPSIVAGTILGILSYSATVLGAISLVVLGIFILVFKLKMKKEKAKLA